MRDGATIVAARCGLGVGGGSRAGARRGAGSAWNNRGAELQALEGLAGPLGLTRLGVGLGLGLGLD